MAQRATGDFKKYTKEKAADPEGSAAGAHARVLTLQSLKIESRDIRDFRVATRFTTTSPSHFAQILSVTVERTPLPSTPSLPA